MDAVLQLAVMLLSAGAVYGGIRSDLKNTRQKAEEAADEARRAHDRLDNHIQYGRRYGE